MRFAGPQPPRLRSLLAAATLLLSACSSIGPSPTPAPTPTPAIAPPPTAGPSPTPEDPQAVYARIASQVEAIRGLMPKSDITPVLLDQAQLTANLTADFDKSNPPQLVEDSQRELIALGLIPAGSSLRTLVLALQAGQVAGYYSRHDKQLFVVSKTGGVGPVQQVTYSHEFTHELQDQNFGLSKLDLQATDQGDRSLARLSLVEGDAVATQSTWMSTNLDQQQLTQVLAASLDPVALQALQSAPVILQQTSLFPYTSGLAFVQTLLAQGGEAAVNAAFGDPPASTEQILHPAKYLAHEMPVTVSVPGNVAQHLGTGWTEESRDTLGEFQLRVWLAQGGVPAAQATTAAAGWGGDRLVELFGPSGATELAIVTAWDTPADADEFAAAVTTALAGYAQSGGIPSARSAHTAGSSTASIVIGPEVDQILGLLPS
ncbi:MAG TPA: hypothetical protein VKR30_05635 [Candidatus Limnocylindrales bacterium]|nr:hypothetical protein [Candidatus Limnocylindrales bacterium]